MILEELVADEGRSGDLARNLRTVRVWRGLKQEQLAERANVNRATVSFIENGRVKPYRSTLEKLAAVLDVPVEMLLDGESRG